MVDLLEETGAQSVGHFEDGAKDLFSQFVHQLKCAGLRRDFSNMNLRYLCSSVANICFICCMTSLAAFSDL